MKKYYFTFGSYEHYPFQNGYITITAIDKADAIKTFRNHYPDYHEDTLNCAFLYTQSEWNKSNNCYTEDKCFENLISESAFWEEMRDDGLDKE